MHLGVLDSLFLCDIGAFVTIEEAVIKLRTIGLSTLALGLLVGPLLAEAQQAGKVYRVGWLRFRSRPPTGANQTAFRQKLNELGFVEGQNLVIELRSAKGEQERLPNLVAELMRLKVDVIFTSPGGEMVHVWQWATRTIPIVMGGIRVDPVEAGLVDSLARPGGNITGLTNLDTELHPKRLELLKEAFPGISRVAILWPEYQQEQGMKEIEAAGKALGVQIQSVDTWNGLDSAFSEISQERADALLVAPSTLVLDHRARIIDFTVKRRLPAIFSSARHVRAGGLMAYGTDVADLFRQAATYVGKILKGAKPADLPVEQPTKFDLLINLKTAKLIGVTIPPEILLQATKVIK